MAQDDSVQVELPLGYWIEEKHRRNSTLRAMHGADEVFLSEMGQSLPPAQWTTSLLGRCIVELDGIGRPDLGAVRNLTIGDREALLLQLRRLTFGDSVPLVLTCPETACKSKMDLTLSTRNLLVAPYPSPQQRHEAVVAEDGYSYRVRFRLPTGGDQEATAPLGLRDPQAAERQLLDRCIESIVLEDGDRALDEMPFAVRQELPGVMLELDPQAEVSLQTHCSSCGSSFVTLFDAGSFVRQELAASLTKLYKEVHMLAYYYHWSESEILHATARRRRAYLEILDEALRQGGGG